MTSRIFLITALLVFLGSAIGLRAGDIPAGEKAKIETLLSHIGGLANAKFIRNDKDYDAKSAAKFLRGKWEANEKKINSAADFIAVAATCSSTTSKPYMIQLKGSPPTPCAEYLTTQLKHLEKK
jgi:hypothetical protein